MFPEYNEIHTGDEIFGYYGYEEIPPYNTIEVYSPDSAVIAGSIRSLGENSCGYIDNGIVNHHFCEEGSYFINMDEKYVYAYFKDIEYADYLPELFILDFLKFNACKMLLIFEDNSFLLEKTEETYKVCKILDEIYESESFCSEVFIPAVQDKNPKKVFYKLMEIYGMKYMDKGVSNYGIIDILLKVLKLDVL